MRVAIKSRGMTRAAAGGALAIVLLLAAPAFACTPGADFTADPGSAAAGAAVHVTGRAFDASSGMPVKINWAAPESSSSRVLLSVPVDENGAFRATVTIPADARLGYYDLHAAQAGGKVARLASGRFEVVPAGQQQPQHNPPPPGQGPTAPADPAPAPSAAPAASTAPAAAPAPSASAPAAAPARAAAPAPAAPAPAAEVAAPAPAAEPAAPVAVEEPARSPSVQSTTSDLWSGFGSATEGPSLDGPAQPVTAPAGSLGGGIALLVVGSLMLLAGAGVAGARRIRAKAQP